jgi:hypothetical protein
MNKLNLPLVRLEARQLHASLLMHVSGYGVIHHEHNRQIHKQQKSCHFIVIVEPQKPQNTQKK